MHDDESFDDVFAEFDDEPLGAASVAQAPPLHSHPPHGGDAGSSKFLMHIRRCPASKFFDFGGLGILWIRSSACLALRSNC